MSALGNGRLSVAAHHLESRTRRLVGPERSASFAVSSVSLPQNPAALTCPNARSASTELLACLREEGGREGGGRRGMNGKNPHPPTGRQAERTDGAQLFHASLGGGGREPAVARLPFSAPFLPLFPPCFDSDPRTPRSSRPPPSKRRRRSPLAGAAARLHFTATAEEHERPQCSEGVLRAAL